ncbi:molybdenum cofactor biosynthesis protein MoaE [bacterium]|nr:molybdenum cofactor biosynthesis protein MoaE [bacterium]
MFKIVESEISIQDVIDAVDTPEAGAIVTFAGVVRNNTEGRMVRYLEFEAYPPMAEKKMKEIADEIYSKWGLEKVVMLHRVGHLEIGELIVAIAVASPHRNKAFEACQYAIDRLKEVVPIWKREVWEDGTEEWVKPG